LRSTDIRGSSKAKKIALDVSVLVKHFPNLGLLVILSKSLVWD
jgi:hypothetical protein